MKENEEEEEGFIILKMPIYFYHFAGNSKGLSDHNYVQMIASLARPQKSTRTHARA